MRQSTSHIDEPVYRNGNGGVRHYHRTKQFSISALTDSSGTIVERYAYSAYGEPTITDGGGTLRSSTAEGNRYTYTGREWDDVAELYHYRARWYDPLSGRFCSRDPIGFEGSEWNVYEYGLNSPLTFFDSSGLASECAPTADIVPRKDRGGHNDGDIFTTRGSRVRYVAKMSGRLKNDCVVAAFSLKPVSRGGGADSGTKQRNEISGTLCPACECKDEKCIASPKQPNGNAFSKSFGFQGNKSDKVDAEGTMTATATGSSVKVCYTL